jgi:uncharacterized protein DUF1592/uncharacterized protein DUF1588/uncharacterized protein DUF1587/uncharacterized protein DUF1585/uncharacterized protein DUF1595/cbb3-type cytochrome c oxidase subunit III
MLVATAATAADFQKDIRPLLQNYCSDCHMDGSKKGELSLDEYPSLEAHLQNQKLWSAVWEMLRAEMMPPFKKPQPKPEERQRIIAWIEREVLKVDLANPDPGRVTIRRLNREEYRNTIRDLLGVEYDVTDAFPIDDTGYGFDTIGDVLSLSPLLMEKYMAAAQEIVAKAVNTSEGRTPVTQISADQFRSKTDPKKNARQLPFSQAAIVEHSAEIQHPGPYHFKTEVSVQGSEEATIHSAEFVVRVNAKEVERRHLSWDNQKSITITEDVILKKGRNLLSFEIVPRTPPLEGEGQLHAAVQEITLKGPTDGSYLEFPKDYYRVFLDGSPPAAAKARRDYAAKIIRHFLERGYRRPVDEPTLTRLVNLAMEVSEQPNMSFEQAIGHALTAIFASPRFIFRAEVQPEPNNPSRVVPLDDYALASRLSYFLWSSLPDDTLFALAREKKLRANLHAQVDRMLTDPKSARFVRNFVGQWLQTRDVETVNIDARRILGIRRSEDAERVFNRGARLAMREETEMLFTHLLTENRSVDELLTANYTFVNERLARIYDIEGIEGNQMRKVSLSTNSHRRGILTHGSFLVVSSNPTRTSPVKRGLFVLENILGTPPPPPPPDVPELEDVRRERGGSLTMRQMMEIHREKPLCASCHARMDPIGLALENFNAIGKFRDEENGQPIDTAGQLITGEKFRNVQELSRILVTSRKKDFYRCLSEKLLTYALGRGVEYYDSPTIDNIVEQMEKDGGKLRALIYGVVESTPFQYRRGDGHKFETVAKRKPAESQ